MFKISHRQTILRASLIGCLIVAVLSTAAYFIINRNDISKAVTRTVDISADGDIGVIYYGPYNTQGVRVQTGRWYKVTLRDGSGTVYNGFCAQASNDDPRSRGKEAKEIQNSDRDGKGGAIKLAIYLWKYSGSNQQINDLKSMFFNLTDQGYWGDTAKIKNYIFTHAVISALYDRDYGNLPSGGTERAQINTGVGILTDAVNASHAAWQQANTYNLYYAKDNDPDNQDVVWIERATGSIIVNKRDSVTGTTPQGDGSFNNITFTLSDGTTTTSKTLTSGATSVTFSGLNLDKKYTISENGGTGYSISPSQSNISPSTSGTQVTFSNNIIKNGLTVYKKDKDTNDCQNISNGLTLAGITFNLYNASSNSVNYENANKPVGSLVASKQLTSSNPCSVSFEGLPYGRYELEEVIPDSLKGWVKDTTRKPITIHPNSSSDPIITYTFENQPIRGDITFIKKDSASNTPMANAVFEISSISENYTENHIVVADANGLVDTRASVNPHTNNTNGYDELYYASESPIAYAGYGTWFGRDKNGNAIQARNDVGALPYGSYLIQELKCDTNMFCTNLNNEKKTFSITTDGQVVNLNDPNSDSWGNDCAEFSLGTTATDNSDGDHYIEVGQNTSIKDVVTYCAKKNYTFTIKGILMDKATNQPILANGETIEQSVEISPTDNDCGTVEMIFPLTDVDLIAGKSIVVFEKLYYKNEEKASHEDINDPEQTVEVVGLGTVAVDNSDDDKIIIPSEETVIKDTVSYCTPTNDEHSSFWIVGTLMDKSTGNPILVNGEPVTKRSESIYQGCGTIDLFFELDTSSIASKSIVVFEELWVYPGDGFGPEHKIISHEDLEDEDQTVYVIDISTTVQPTENGTKIFPLDSDVTVTDMVHYCLQPGLEYTVKGVVMDKSTGNGLLVDSKLVEQSVTFTPTEACGEFPMYYTFNTKGLAGAKLVIFESLYHNDELLIEHKDIENELESFEIDITPPETGFITKTTSGSQETSHQEFLIIAIIAIAPVGAYAINRRQARKHFLNR